MPWVLSRAHSAPKSCKHGWVRNRDLVKQAGELVEALPRPYRFLFNAIFWDGLRFKRFCTVPSSMNGHHSDESGNLCHAVEVQPADADRALHGLAALPDQFAE